MPLPRPLLQLCALLLVVFAVTAAHAEAPPYGPNELRITIELTPDSKTRSAQIATCQANGGALLPMVTDAVCQATQSRMDSSGIDTAVGHMGGSSMLSPATCTTSTATLGCVWYWDEGRYAGAGNELAFYKGNRHISDLPGAAMIGTLVGNHWRVDQSNNVTYPGPRMQRYGVAIRRSGPLGWADSSDTEWTYGDTFKTRFFTFCSFDPSTSTPLTSLTPSTTSTTVDPNAGKSTGLSVGAIVGIVAGIVVAVGVIIALVWHLKWKGCCCFARYAAEADTSSAGTESVDADESCCAASQRGGMSRTNSFRSRHSGYGDFSNRSFHDGAAGKDGYSRRSSFHGSMGEAEAELRQNDYEMTSVAGSQYSRTASRVYGSCAPPPRAASQMMMQPQPPTSMYGNWHTYEAPMSVSILATKPSGAEMQRRPSNVSILKRNVTNAHNNGAADCAMLS